MTMNLKGGCLCGAVRYQANCQPLHTFFCHCRDCQKESGGPFTAEIYLPANSVTVTGRLKRYSRQGDSGNEVHRHFCIECGTVVLTTFDVDTGNVCVKACSLDDPSWLKPEFHLYVSSKQPWDTVADELPQHSEDF